MILAASRFANAGDKVMALYAIVCEVDAQIGLLFGCPEEA